MSVGLDSVNIQTLCMCRSSEAAYPKNGTHHAQLAPPSILACGTVQQDCVDFEVLRATISKITSANVNRSLCTATANEVA